MKFTYRLNGLDCAHCAAKIEREVGKIEGVEKATLSFMTTKLTVEADDSLKNEITEKIVSIVNKFEPDVVVKRG